MNFVKELMEHFSCQESVLVEGYASLSVLNKGLNTSLQLLKKCLQTDNCLKI